MPEQGVKLSPDAHLLTTSEITRLARLFVGQGVTKIRLTGGEPTVRPDILELVDELGKLKLPASDKRLTSLGMTTNGLVLTRKVRRNRMHGNDVSRCNAVEQAADCRAGPRKH